MTERHHRLEIGWSLNRDEKRDLNLPPIWMINRAGVPGPIRNRIAPLQEWVSNTQSSAISSKKLLTLQLSNVIVKHNMKQDESLMIKCDCGAEAMEIQYWEDDNIKEFTFAFWQQGFSRPLCWRERLRWCWNILRTGNPWSDTILLYPEKTKQVVQFLNKHLQNNG